MGINALNGCYELACFSLLDSDVDQPGPGGQISVEFVKDILQIGNL